MSAVTAALAPTPPTSGSGSRKPNIARLGTVWNTLAIDTSGALMRGRLAARIPIEKPTMVAAAVAAATSSTCTIRACPTSNRCAAQNLMTDMSVDERPWRAHTMQALEQAAYVLRGVVENAFRWSESHCPSRLEHSHLVGKRRRLGDI